MVSNANASESFESGFILSHCICKASYDDFKRDYDSLFRCVTVFTLTSPNNAAFGELSKVRLLTFINGTPKK